MTTVRAVLAGWRVFLPVVLLTAVAQALLVLADPVPAVGWSFAGLALASFAVVVAAITLIAAAGAGRVRPALPVWVAGLGLVIGAAAVLSPWLAPPLLLVGALVLPPVADGAPRPVRTAFRAFRVIPARAVAGLLVLLVVAVLSWAAALLSGLLVTGPLSAAVTWLWFGVLAVLVLGWSTALYRRAADLSRRVGERPRTGP